MNLTEQQKKGQEILNTIIKKSWEDDSFKQELINNPNETLSKLEELEVTVTNNTKIIVEDQTNSNTIFFNIPRKPDYSTMELSDEQLEVVAGGEVGLALVGIFAAGIAIGMAMKQ